MSGCVESLFLHEHGDVVARMRACAAAGLAAVEFWLWRDKDLDAIERVLGETGLALSGFCVELAGGGAGEPGGGAAVGGARADRAVGG